MPTPAASSEPVPEAHPAFAPRPSPRDAWAYFIRAWRPACGWLIALLLASSLLVRLVQLCRREPIEPLDWTALSALGGVLFVTRSYDRSQGLA